MNVNIIDKPAVQNELNLFVQRKTNKEVISTSIIKKDIANSR